MFSVEIDHLIRKEQYKDLQRDIVRQQLIQVAKRPSNKIVSLRKIAGGIGTRMVAWGSKLQHQEQYQHQTLSR